MGQILIKTPLTHDGLQVILGADGKIQYREDLANDLSRRDFEKKNEKLPTNLKMIIEDYYPEQPKKEQPVKQVENPADNPELSKAVRKVREKKIVS